MAEYNHDEWLKGVLSRSWEPPKPVAAPAPVEDVGGFQNAFAQSIGSTAAGIGQLGADFIPGVSKDNALKSWGEEYSAAHPTAIHSLEDIKAAPWTAAKEAVGGAAGFLLPTVGTGGVGGALKLASGAGRLSALARGTGAAVSAAGPTVAAALPSYGGIRPAQGSDEWYDKAAALAAALTIGRIETKFGPQEWALKALSSEGRGALAKKFAGDTLAKRVGKGVGLGAAVEGAEEMVQNPIEQVASYQNPFSEESMRETAFGGAMGAIGGGVLGGGMAAVTGRKKNLLKPTERVSMPDVEANRGLTPDMFTGEIGPGKDVYQTAFEEAAAIFTPTDAQGELFAPREIPGSTGYDAFKTKAERKAAAPAQTSIDPTTGMPYSPGVVNAEGAGLPPGVAGMQFAPKKARKGEKVSAVVTPPKVPSNWADIEATVTDHVANGRMSEEQADAVKAEAKTPAKARKMIEKAITETKAAAPSLRAEQDQIKAPSDVVVTTPAGQTVVTPAQKSTVDRTQKKGVLRLKKVQPTATIPAPEVPTDSTQTADYEASLATYLTSGMDIVDLAIAEKMVGSEAAVKSSTRALAKEIGGISHEGVRKRGVLALSKIKANADAAGVDWEVAKRVLGLSEKTEDDTGAAGFEGTTAVKTVMPESFEFDETAGMERGETAGVEAETAEAEAPTEAEVSTEEVLNDTNIQDAAERAVGMYPPVVVDLTAELYGPAFMDLSATEQLYFVQKVAQLAKMYGHDEKLFSAKAAKELGVTDVKSISSSETESRAAKPEGKSEAVGERGEGGAEGVVVGKADISKIKVVTKKSRKIEKKFSEGKAKAGHTAESLWSAINKLFVYPAKARNIVTIYATQAEAVAAGELRAGMGPVGGWQAGNKVALIAENIQPGKELGVILHEVGAHLGMEKLVGKDGMKFLSDKVGEWASRNDNSVESLSAKRAIKRALKSSSKDKSEENIAYMVEELVDAGVDPKAGGNSEVDAWYTRLLAALTAALKKLGFKSRQFTGQNLVDLAFGAANIELEDSDGTATGGKKMSEVGSRETINYKSWQAMQRAEAFLRKKGGYKTVSTAKLHDGTYDVTRVKVDPKKFSYVGQKAGFELMHAVDMLEAADRDYKGMPGLRDVMVKDIEEFQLKMKAPERATLRKAKAMEKKGAGVEDIKDATGWFKAQDGKWRLHFDDAEARLLPHSYATSKGKTGSARLRDVFSHPKLFRMYPQIGDAWLTPDPDTPPGDGELNVTESGTPQIFVSLAEMKAAIKGDKEAELSLSETILHEIQHAIQDVESFARGGSPSINILTHKDVRNGLTLKMLKGDFSYEDRRTLGVSTVEAAENMVDTALEGMYGIFAEPTNEAERKKREELIPVLSRVARLAYDNLHGELEARQTEEDYAPGVPKRYGTEIPSFATKNSIVIKNTGRSRKAPSKKFSEVASAEKSMAEILKVSQQVTDTKHILKKSVGWMTYLHDLVRKVEKEMPAAKTWYEGILKTQETRLKMERDAEKVAAMASSMKEAEYKQVNAFLENSTVSQKWGYAPEWNKGVVVDADLATQWNVLSKDQQKIADAVFKHGFDSIARKRDLFKKLGVQDVMSNLGALTGPYAPLKRFGKFVAVLKSQVLVDAEAKLKAEDTKANRDVVEALKKDGANYKVSSFDTPGLAEQFVKEEGSKYAFADSFASGEKIASEHAMSYQAMQTVMAAVKADPTLPSQVRAEMENTVRALYLSSLDETNARQSGQKRKNTAGFHEDMVRSFLAGARADAAYVANLEHGGETNDAFYKMQEVEVKDASGRRKYQDDFNLLAEHYAENMKYDPAPIQDRIVGLTSAWQLTTSLAYHLTNMSQGFMVTLPRLAAEGNYGSALKHLLDGYKIVGDVMTGMTADLSKVKNAGMREALELAANRGILDVGIEEDLGQFDQFRSGYKAIDGTSRWASKALHKLRSVSRAVETVNRVSSGAAAYSQAIEQGKTAEQAQQYVIDVLQSTQGDFSRLGAPLLLKRIPKVMAQYRKYQFMMMAFYVKAFNQAFKGATAEERTIGKRMLAFKLTHTAVAAGALGLPLMNLAGMMFGPDDDDPEDLEMWLKSRIGNEDLANLLLHGVSAVTPLDMSAKLGEENIFSVAPYTDFDLTSREGVAKTVAGVAGGPAMGLAQKMADGVGLIQDGQMTKGVERMLPSGLGSALSAFRMANEGFSLKNGDVVVKPGDMETWGLALALVGLPASQIKELTKERGVQFQLNKHFDDRTKEIRNDYSAAWRDKDRETMLEMRKEWMDLQKQKRIARKRYFNNNPKELRVAPLSSLIKTPIMERRRAMTESRSLSE